MKILELYKIFEYTTLEEYISQLDLNLISDEDLNKLCIYKVSMLDIGKRKRRTFINLLTIAPFTRKQAIIALKKLKDMKFLPYLYRHTLVLASDNNVPKPVIEQYVLTKKSYKNLKKNYPKNEHIEKYRINLEVHFNLLYGCTIEMIERNKTRKEKIFKILERKNGGY